jgi:hypothetical protein
MDFGLARYNADGSLDTGFGAGGLTTTDMSTVDSGSSGNAFGEAAALQANGGILLAGFDQVPISAGISYHFLVARYFGTSPFPSGGGGTTGGGGGGSAGGGGGVNPITVIVGALKANHHIFYVGKLPPHFTRAIPTGTTISFSVNPAARVTFAFARLLPGKRSGRRCVAPKPKLKHARSCTRRIKAGSLSFNATAGTHKLFFDGKLSNRRKLRPGRYELAVTAAASGRITRRKVVTGPAPRSSEAASSESGIRSSPAKIGRIMYGSHR